jgi:hypothetical protein
MFLPWSATYAMISLMKYSELGYSLPPIDAQIAADKAIAVLEQIERNDPASLFYVIQASNILALAELRGLSPYMDFEPNFSKHRKVTLSSILHDNGYEIIMEKDLYADNRQSSFLLLSVEGISNIPKRYTVVRPFWKMPNDLTDFSDFLLWSMHAESSLVDLMSADALPSEWLNDWWAPHNIRFGMLLGYPGEAITSYCWDMAKVKGEKLHQALTVSMPFQGAYSGAHVTYDYSPEIADLSDLKAHESLWSQVLVRVYEVFSEARLTKLPEFMAEFARYKAYDER